MQVTLVHNPTAGTGSPTTEELLQILERPHFFERVEIELLLEFEPKRAAGRLVKVPGNRFHNVPIEGVFGLALGFGEAGRHGAQRGQEGEKGGAVQLNTMPSRSVGVPVGPSCREGPVSLSSV